MNNELIIKNEDIELLIEMKNNCLKSDIYNDEKRLLKANAITKFLLLLQENQQLHNKIGKAIRYIKKNKHYIDIEDMKMYLYEDDIEKVLEILKGW